MWGVRDRALSHCRPLVVSGVRPRPTTHWLWVRGMRASGPITNPTARALASWLCALWGRHEGARGGRLLPGCGASGDGRSPTPDHSSFRACGEGPLPTGRGCGVRASGPGCPWHLFPCRGSSCVVRASRVQGTRWLLWLGTCPRAVAVAGACLSGVPRGHALVRRASSGQVALGAPVDSPVAVVPSPTPGAAPPWLYWVAARGTWRPAENQAHFCLPLAPAEASALGALRVVPVRGPAMGLSLEGGSGFRLRLRAPR